jgi:hypothetical protein
MVNELPGLPAVAAMAEYKGLSDRQMGWICAYVFYALVRYVILA